MGSRDINVTQAEVDRMVRGVVMQLQATGIADGHESFAAAMHATGMWDYVYHQAEVLAYAYADNRRLSTIVNKR